MQKKNTYIYIYKMNKSYKFSVKLFPARFFFRSVFHFHINSAGRLHRLLFNRNEYSWRHLYWIDLVLFSNVPMIIYVRHKNTEKDLIKTPPSISLSLIDWINQARSVSETVPVIPIQTRNNFQTKFFQRGFGPRQNDLPFRCT